MIYKVSYSYAAPNGALRSGAHIIEAPDANSAKAFVRDILVGKLRFLSINSATLYKTEQQELDMTPATKKK